MKHEEAEAIISSPDKHTEAEVAEARALLRLDMTDDEISKKAEEGLKAVLAVDKELAKSAEKLEQKPGGKDPGNFDDRQQEYQPRLSLTETLELLAKSSTGADHAVYNELLVIIGETKVRIKNVAARVIDDQRHLVHELDYHFRSL